MVVPGARQGSGQAGWAHRAGDRASRAAAISPLSLSVTGPDQRDARQLVRQLLVQDLRSRSNRQRQARRGDRVEPKPGVTPTGRVYGN